ncbi:MAG TPA: OsmC family peroxiredoxin [Gemmatimonadaceae bacterium]|nr:OsmC family peroxiredoxin [Gemmatimonadaceae bacterium]
MKTATFTRSAEIAWNGDVVRGSGTVRAASGAFDVPASFPTLRGESAGVTTPEELLAASHAVCFGIGLRSVIGRNGGIATTIRMTATITAEKGPEGIRVRRSHLVVAVEGLQGIDPARLPELGATVERECTISSAIRDAVEISYEITALTTDPQ